MKPSRYVTVRRSDLPTWLNWPSGKVLIGDSRAALLIGGKPRRVRVQLGDQEMRVVIDSFLPGTHSITLNVTVEEGGEYRYCCRRIPGVFTIALAQGVGFILAMICATALGRLVLPEFRQELIGLQSQAVLALPDLNPALIPILYRAALAFTSELSGTFIGGMIFLGATRRVRAKLWSRCLFYLDKEESKAEIAIC